MDDTLLTARICRARRVAADHRFATAAEMLNTPDFWASVTGRDEPDLIAIQSDLAWWLAWSGHSRQALEILDRLARERASLDGLLVRILSRRAYVTGMASNPKLAADRFEELARRLNDTAGVTARTQLHVARQGARWLGTAGDVDGALSLLLALESEWAQRSGTNQRERLLLKSNIAYFMSQRGESSDTEQCLRRYEELITSRTELLGPSHPDTLDARRNRAWVLGLRDPVTAMMQLRQLLSDSLVVLESQHRYVMVTRLDLAVMLTRAALADPGFAELASSELAQLVDELSAALAEAETPEDVLSEYGRTDLSLAKLDEIHEYLEGVGLEVLARETIRAQDRLQADHTS